jgi:lysyl-tRNA synthetase class 2
MVELKRLVGIDTGLEDGFKSFKKVIRNGDWICKYRC